MILVQSEVEDSIARLAQLSRVVLDANDAELQLGRGEMLYLPPGTHKLERIHGDFVSEDEGGDGEE